MIGIRELSEYHQAYKEALEIYRQWEELDDPQLLSLFNSFETKVRPLVERVDPGWNHCGGLGRHMTFMNRNLTNGNKRYSYSDAVDMVFYDLPTLADFMLSQANLSEHLDERLAQATSRLFEIQDYASVIRATFPVLSSRLRRLFGVPEGTDGENLVNDVFSRGQGTNPVVLPQEEKTSYRHLVAGFYTTYRNKLNHGDYQPTFAQARGVVEMANTLIKDLEQVAEASLLTNTNQH